MNKVVYIILFLLSAIAFGQSAKESVVEKKVEMKKLDSQLSARVLKAYQFNSDTKIEDLYAYFELLTDARLDKDTKHEIAENIKLMFKNENPIVLDVTSDFYDKVTLDMLLEKLQFSEPIQFTIQEQKQHNSVQYNSWKTSYTIIRTKNGLPQDFKITQTIFLELIPKKFGATNKVVWEMRLGEM